MTVFRSKRARFAGLAAVLALFAVELVSYIGIGAIHGHWFDTSPFQDQRRFLIGAESDPASGGGPRPGFVETAAMHPFVGYVDPGHPYRKGVVEGYPLRIKAGQRLLQDGVNFLDWTHAYESVEESLYIDTCCHVNERGNELLVDDLVRAILDGYRDLAHD